MFNINIKSKQKSIKSFFCFSLNYLQKYCPYKRRVSNRFSYRLTIAVGQIFRFFIENIRFFSFFSHRTVFGNSRGTGKMESFLCSAISFPFPPWIFASHLIYLLASACLSNGAACFQDLLANESSKKPITNTHPRTTVQRLRPEK